jgi:hypothetical protein
VTAPSPERPVPAGKRQGRIRKHDENGCGMGKECLQSTRISNKAIPLTETAVPMAMYFSHPRFDIQVVLIRKSPQKGGKKWIRENVSHERLE